MRPGTNPTLLWNGQWLMSGVFYFIPQAGTFLGEFHPRNGPYPNWSEGDVVEHPTFGPKLLFQDMATNGVNFLSWFTVPDALPPTYSERRKILVDRPLTTEIKLTEYAHAERGSLCYRDQFRWSSLFSERNSPRLGSVDPNTMYVTEYHLPNLESRPRGITVTPDYVVWYTDYARGYLGRFDPKTGKFSEWASPSGPQSLPTGSPTLATLSGMPKQGPSRHVGSLRPPDGEISKLAGKGGRRNPAHLCGRGRKSMVYPSPGQWHRPSHNKGGITSVSDF